MRRPRSREARPEDTVSGTIAPPAWWLVPLVYALTGLAFLSDLLRSNIVAFGIIYAPLVATAVFHKNRSGLAILTVATCAMVIIGAFFPIIDPDLPDLIANRGLSILAILATAAFVHHARVTHERLAEQTHRAEEAERIKTDVFTNLSEEMRTPLHGLLGLLRLMLAGCRPDQRESLERVRDGSKQLLETIDNLIDLTRIPDQVLQSQTVDLSDILRDAADRARNAARERRIDIAFDMTEPYSQYSTAGRVSALADEWATRRILDNLIASVVRFAAPGGTISLATDREDGIVAACVSDTGRRPPPGFSRLSRDDEADPDSTDFSDSRDAGLTLSHRLARGMNGRLSLINQSGPGVTIMLTLPAAEAAAA